MKLTIGQREFAPGLVPTLVTLLLLPVLINLGLWQLRRADEKRVLLAQAAAGQTQTVTLTAANAAQLARYQHVQLRGTFDSHHQILLDNMPSAKGQPGYRIWTPLKLSDASIVLIDRGWLPNWMSAGDTNHAVPPLDVAEQVRDVRGILDELPRPGVRAGNAGISNTWPLILNYPRLTELRQLYGDSLQSRLVLLDADDANGFERVWQHKTLFGPERHIAYAVQWFGLAITLLIIYVIVNLKRPHNKHDKEYV